MIWSLCTRVSTLIVQKGFLVILFFLFAARRRPRGETRKVMREEFVRCGSDKWSARLNTCEGAAAAARAPNTIIYKSTFCSAACFAVGGREAPSPNASNRSLFSLLPTRNSQKFSSHRHLLRCSRWKHIFYSHALTQTPNHISSRTKNRQNLDFLFSHIFYNLSERVFVLELPYLWFILKIFHQIILSSFSLKN